MLFTLFQMNKLGKLSNLKKAYFGTICERILKWGKASLAPFSKVEAKMPKALRALHRGLGRINAPGAESSLHIARK